MPQLPRRPIRQTYTPDGAGRQRPPSRDRVWLTFAAVGLLGLFAVVLGWRMVDAGVEALRGWTYQRPDPSGTTAAAEHPDPVLQARLENEVRLPDGTLAVVVRDLTAGGAARLNADEPLPSASLFKIPILVEVLKQQRLERIAPEQMLEIEQAHWASGSGVLQARVGEQLSVQELTDLMIRESDNIAALVLLDAVGAENVNATMESLGLSATRVRDRGTGETGPHLTSASDMARLLEIAATGQLIDAETSEQALRLLESKQANSWLSDELPWWIKLAHKWGEVPGVRNDAGIVFAPERTFVAVVLTEGGSPADAQQAIADTARIAYEHLRGSAQP